MKDVRRRIKSVENTMKITNAMKLVSASKLRKAKIRFEKVSPFFEHIHESMWGIAKRFDVHTLNYVKKGKSSKILYIVVGGDRGLAGGYNINVFRKAMAGSVAENTIVLPIGKVAVDYFRKNKFRILHSYSNIGETITIEKAYHMASMILFDYNKDMFSEIRLAYTGFISTLSQEPIVKKVLPLSFEGVSRDPGVRPIVDYDPSPEAVLEAIVPQYFAGILYGGIVEAFAAEQAARSTAMDSATNNASDIIDELTLKYNGLRQAAITRELTEIVSGAAAS